MNQKIEVVGLGAGDINQLPLGIYKKLTSTTEKVYVRTFEHPVVEALQAEGVLFESFDNIYESNQQFADVYQKIAKELIEQSGEGNVIYAVPGHPMLAEKTVQLLLEQKEVTIDVVGGQSYLDDLFTGLKIDPIDGFQFVDATSFNRHQLDYRHHLIFCQVYDRFTASNVKLALLEDLPADYQVTVVEAAGSKQEKMTIIPLEQLDHSMEVNNLTSVYIPPVSHDLLHHTFSRLREVIAKLRSPDGCPWDKEQTHESLREYAIEEVYELIDAIDDQDDDGIVEELGDILLQVMLHSQIGEDNGYFVIDDVIKSITDKMIHRHPHVFGDKTVDSVADVYTNWDALKREEKGDQRKSVLDGVSKSIPALAKAYQLQKKAAKVGFAWETVDGAWDKLQEEIKEVQEAIEENDQVEVEKELGDVLFVLANISRYYKVNPEVALNRTNQKFISRFSYIEEKVNEQAKDINEVSLKEMDALWDQAKEKE
ncbi:nucleoside triphosphate pyrophosphohydrolase [Lentibacillus sp. Marseille-P4043]|uniref:nucleoside triphosphate pyrophosphohydrolase n=1 Tax=Lentibacillus sp. Marseille-P4043 TaxID=2040293 RepID=UPI000D0BE648|nr:nucleoside triphosphate pyrophosphohydrolase [Lentibacillus sp. Marseille-P4043]